MLKEGDTLTVGNHNVTVVRYLSEGGFSKIYEVVMDPAEGGTTTGCLKQVLVPDKAGLNTLRKEVDVMKTLKSARSIVRYYDSNAERLPDGSYQVLVLMELCPNKSLLDFMNDRIRQKLTEPEILKILLDISIGIYEMHKLKLIHRDIKIENVLIDAKHSFKLCDFGSVSSPIRPPQGQQEFQLLSHDILYNTTPQYRSPEMIDLYRGFPIDERSDIWALGCFVYKLCYFTTPFEANGDIAILHASFQFPPAPAYSGDLKNLIIIMLQENPVYRPNIVQILVLLAKLLNTEFEKFNIEDFYGAGEYNFQALHEMQTEKHKQLLKQQQYYLEQQKQQQAYELSKKQALSKSSSQASLSRLSRQNSAHAADTSFYSKNNLEVKSDISEGNRSVANEEILVGNSHLSNVTPKESVVLDGAESSSDGEDLHVDLPELDNIAERFPSLDSIGHSSHDLSGLENTSRVKNERSSLEITRDSHKLETTVSRDPLDMGVIEPSKSRTDLESAEAWQQDSSSKRDDKTQMLADEIFANPQRTKSTASSKSSRAPEKPASEELSRISTPLSPRNRSRSREASRDPILETKGTQSIPSVRLTQATSDVEAPNFHSAQAQSGDIQRQDIHVEEPVDSNSEFKGKKSYNFNQSVPNVEQKRGSSNPWGSAIGCAVPPSTREPDLNLQNQMGNLSLGSYFDTPTRTAQENLIDFDEVHPKSNGVQKSAPTETPPLPARRVVEESLIDMNLGGTDALTLETKPSFKKRGSEISAQPLNFEEQVVDFASDDENLNSEMNRVSIRNTLRKTRKSNETRRSDSSNAESKKRHSFFGGSSD